MLINLSLILLASASNYTLGADIAITADPTFAHWESSIQVSGRDPRRLVASCVVTSSNEKEKIWNCKTYWSGDAGETWNLSVFDAPTRLGDATISFGPDKEVYFASLYKPSNGLGRGVAVYASNDFGETFAPLVLPYQDASSADHDMSTVDCTRSKYRGRLYVAAEYSNDKVRVHSSSDGGKTFTTAVAVSPWVKGFVDNLCVLSDGTLFVPIRTEDKFQTDAKGSFAGASAENYCVTSSDGGNTFSAPSKICDCIDLPANGHGGGGPNDYAVGTYHRKERIYCVWGDTRTRSDRTYLVYSEDKGKTWTPPQDITPVVESSVANVVNIAVAPDGTVGISWLSSDHEGDQLFFAASRDGGMTFMAPLPIATKRGPGDSPGSKRINGGDYTFMSCGADNKFHTIWQDTGTGVYQLHTRTVQVSAN